ncbi:MAG: hypothetical protein KJO30_15220 [Boseongicola sp.]|nr:hypothetical protein [Boseongicola sp.]NNJ66497.1 hypothetical protein [Boseongicola sp.]
MGFLVRWLVAFILLAVTFNPTELNFVRWANESWNEQTSFVVLFGLVLLVIYVVFLTAVLRGIGALGVTLVLAVVAAMVWVLLDLGWLSLENPGAMTWVAILALSVVLAVGMYWGILWRRISGQIEVDDDGDI